MTTGARTAFSRRVSTRMTPRPMDRGSLTTLTAKKNQAVVPRKGATANREASRYMVITGPPALAVIVVNPDRVP